MHSFGQLYQPAMLAHSLVILKAVNAELIAIAVGVAHLGVVDYEFVPRNTCLNEVI